MYILYILSDEQFIAVIRKTTLELGSGLDATLSHYSYVSAAWSDGSLYMQRDTNNHVEFPGAVGHKLFKDIFLRFVGGFYIL